MLDKTKNFYHVHDLRQKRKLQTQTKVTYKKIIAQNFLKIIKRVKSKFQKLPKSPKKINKIKIIPRHKTKF